MSKRLAMFSVRKSLLSDIAFITCMCVASCAPASAIEWRTDLSEAQIRSTHWGQDVRHVSAAMKRAVYARDGYTGAHDSRCPCEVDHIGPRCLGGADTMRNLQIQPYAGPWNAHMKDEVEWYACAHFRHETLSLAAARAIFDGDWRVAYTNGWRIER